MASFDENGKYIKTNWKAGDKITATKLNKIEESIEAVNDNDISRHVEADARLDALEAKDDELSEQLAHNASNVTYKSKNLMSYSNDLLTAFNMAMEDTENNIFHLDNGIFTTSGTLCFARGKHLILNDKTVIRTTNGQEPVVKMARECSLKGGRIDVSNINYTSSAVFYDGDNLDLETSTLQTDIYGSYGKDSVGIHMKSTANSSSYVMYNKIDCYIWHFNHAVKLESENGGYCTGNIFEGRIFGASNLIYIKGAGCSGNKFDFMCQSGLKIGSDTDYYGVYCEGSFNTFKGYIWDISSSYTNNFCYFTKSSCANSIDIRCVNGDGSYLERTIKDYGRNNIVGNIIPYQGVFFPSPIMCDREGSSSLLGLQDDFLSYADKNKDFEITKTFNKVTEVNNGTYIPSNLFTPKADTSMYIWDNDLTGSFEINIKRNNAISLSLLSISFGSGTMCDVACSLINSNTGEVLYYEKIDKRDKDRTFANMITFYMSLKWGGTVNNKIIDTDTIKLEFSNPSGKNIFIRNILGGSSNTRGNAFLYKDGGDMYGDIIHSKNTGIVLTSPDGSTFRIKVSNDGSLSTDKL